MYCEQGIRAPGNPGKGQGIRGQGKAAHIRTLPLGPFRGRGFRGFSLVEIMVVIVIIGLLAGVVAIKVGDYVEKARSTRAKSDIATIVGAIETYHAEHGVYPTMEQGLDVLPLKNRNDPWGRPYVYTIPGREEPFDVMSLGADGREGGAPGTADEDIGSWQLGESSTTGAAP